MMKTIITIVLFATVFHSIAQEGFVNEFHKANAGKIYFSKNVIWILLLQVSPIFRISSLQRMKLPHVFI